MTHHLKLREEFWDAVINCEKTFEVRYNDRAFQKGDKDFVCFSIHKENKL
jgi:ASC-1-like (ASCH) protein